MNKSSFQWRNKDLNTTSFETAISFFNVLNASYNKKNAKKSIFSTQQMRMGILIP